MLCENMEGLFSDVQDGALFADRMQSRMRKLLEDSNYKVTHPPGDLPTSSASTWKSAIGEVITAAMDRFKRKGNKIFFDPDLQQAYDNSCQKPATSQSEHSWTSLLSVRSQVFRASQSDFSASDHNEGTLNSAKQSGSDPVLSHTTSLCPSLSSNPLPTSPGQATQVTVAFPSTAKSAERSSKSSHSSNNISNEFPCAQPQIWNTSPATSSEAPASKKTSVPVSGVSSGNSTCTYVTAPGTPKAYKTPYGHKTVVRPPRKRQMESKSPDTSAVPKKKVKQKSVAIQMPSQRTQ